MKIVAPFRPFAPESQAHHLLGPFNWIEALELQRTSALFYGHCEAYAITDVDTDLPGPCYRYATAQRRLMLWILEVCLKYLESDDFDQDTAMVSPDILVYGELQHFFEADLGIVLRVGQKFVINDRRLLNSVQFWRLSARDGLVAFYRNALAIACRLPEAVIRWGADTEPLVELLQPLPLKESLIERAGLTVQCIDHRRVLRSVSTVQMARLDAGLTPEWPTTPLLDFKYLRKQKMAAFFHSTIGVQILYGTQMVPS